MQNQLKYYVNCLVIKNLWGYRNISLTFNEDITILIGPNASGKTTILNILNYALTCDVKKLLDTHFEYIKIELKSFDTYKSRRITKTIRIKKTDDGMDFYLSKKMIHLYGPTMQEELFIEPSITHKRRLRQYNHNEARKFREQLKEIAPIVWLPISRRLPIPVDEDPDIRHRSNRYTQLESVDAKLMQLIDQLARYRLKLDSNLSELYKNFEKKVLQIVLYSEQHDNIASIQGIKAPKEEDRNSLLRAFKTAGILDQGMKKKIESHFEETENALNRIKQSAHQIRLSDTFAIPLISRTKEMVEYARVLESDRKELFEPLTRYEKIINSFFQDKTIAVEEKGELIIKSQTANQVLAPQILSSGEKQIFILLTQALLRENSPVIYVTDEPELSLHIEWQSKLLESLLELGRKIQIIVATHSPDIVGPYREKVHDLRRAL